MESLLQFWQYYAMVGSSLHVIVLMVLTLIDSIWFETLELNFELFSLRCYHSMLPFFKNGLLPDTLLELSPLFLLFP